MALGMRGRVNVYKPPAQLTAGLRVGGWGGLGSLSQQCLESFALLEALVAPGQADALEYLGDRIAGLSTPLHPIIYTLFFDDDRRRLGARIILPQNFEKTA